MSVVILKLDFEKAYDRVSWTFLREVLSQKDFESGVIHRLMQLVNRGQTAISINGKVGPYFRNNRRVHRVTLSPLCYSILWQMSWQQCWMLLKMLATSGAVPHLVQGGVTHL